ncbi:MAG: hypothetical protein EOO73_34755 [Myxococcales bacterium]|nr:MAG: hypothetical protein EOO73_34755 [Myxococcales bacterium]
MTAPAFDPTIAYTPIVQGLPWEVAAWIRRKPGRVVARDGRDVLLIDGAIHLRFPTLTAACAAVAL